MHDNIESNRLNRNLSFFSKRFKKLKYYYIEDLFMKKKKL